MAERAVPRRARAGTVVVIVAALAVVAAGGVWLAQLKSQADAVGEAPRTAAVQKAGPGRATQEARAEAALPREAGVPGVRECGLGEPIVEPEIITLNCSNAGVVASNIKWTRYTAEGASGSGVVQVSGGANSGAVPVSFPARLRLYGARTVDGMTAFTELEVDYTGATPFGDPSETYTIV
ncbi:hypothetical protein ACFP1Z_21805 [Streptomyces gamaensis]|uniref:Uncharacterized protein n=1 Tax=Streptomyces gamaensis TaxID=1763542 RepID=A0ABW0Z3V3_9ACTN